MKGYILAADMSNGISTVTKQTKYGTYTSSVKIHEDDNDIANAYDGCYFAEMKCDIKAYHEKAMRMKERARGIEHAYNVLLDSCDPDDPHMIKLERQVIVAWQQYNNALETYKILKESYYPFIETTLKSRREFRKKIDKRRNMYS